MSSVIFNGKKAKGVNMEEPPIIPQMVGISKKQFFCILIAAMLFGASFIILGFALAPSKTESKEQNNKSKKNKKNLTGAIGLATQVLPGGQALSAQTNVGICYISMGTFRNESAAKNLSAMLTKLGKIAQIKIINGYYLVYLGPYNSESLAKSELDSISLSEVSLKGSIIIGLP